MSLISSDYLLSPLFLIVSLRLVKRNLHMTLTFSLAPIISLVAGILILAMPRLLNYIVALYLIVIGIVGILNLNI